MHVVVAGCGWLGAAIGVELLARGHRVTAIRRDPVRASELATLGLEPLVLDLSHPEAHQSFPADVQAIVGCQSARSNSADGYRSAYWTVNQTLIAAAEALRVQALVYTGSTGVFGFQDGREVNEQTPAAPTGPSAAVLHQAEQLLVDAARRGIPTRVVRLSGLYGPGRWGMRQRVQSGALALGDGDTAFMNFCHRDDAVEAVIGAMLRGTDGVIYHASDADPPRRRDVVTWLAGQLGIIPPVSQQEANSSAPNRRVSAAWTRQQLGLTLKFANFREGFSSVVSHA